jgi:hypothetical protein
MFGPTGVTHSEPDRVFPGYTLFATLSGDELLLIDNGGQVVKRWRAPGNFKPYYAFIVPDSGNLLLRCTSGKETWGFGGASGAVVELDWDGNVVWQYEHPTLHHDHCRLRNGNTLMLAWEVLEPDMAKRIRGGVSGSELAPGVLDEDFCWVPDLAAQSGTERAAGTIIGDSLIEVDRGGNVVWTWHGSDHLDPAVDVICPLEGRQEWTHGNAVEEMPDGNIILSFRQTSTILTIDKASGEVLWRWGPGELSHQHDPTITEDGNILIFDNGEHRLRGSCYSRVVEMEPNKQQIVWEYRGSPPLSFFSTGISSAQRLANGNTLVCEGRTGRLFEVTRSADVVWEFINPYEFPHRGDQRNRAIFRAAKYAADSPELRGRV